MKTTETTETVPACHVSADDIFGIIREGGIRGPLCDAYSFGGLSGHTNLDIFMAAHDGNMWLCGGLAAGEAKWVELADTAPARAYMQATAIVR